MLEEGENKEVISFIGASVGFLATYLLFRIKN